MAFNCLLPAASVILAGKHSLLNVVFGHVISENKSAIITAMFDFFIFYKRSWGVFNDIKRKLDTLLTLEHNTIFLIRNTQKFQVLNFN